MCPHTLHRATAAIQAHGEKVTKSRQSIWRKYRLKGWPKMDTYDTGVVIPTASYTEEDHQTWNKLCTRQTQLVADVACRAFLEGFVKLDLDFMRLPERDEFSARIQPMSGWTLGDAQNEYLGATEWFDHLAARRFPVTDYIR